MGIMVLRHQSAALQKCDLPDCKNVSRTLYRVQIGEHWYKFCGSVHAQIGNGRFQSKVAQGITGPNLEQEDRVELPEGGDNIAEFE